MAYFVLVRGRSYRMLQIGCVILATGVSFSGTALAQAKDPVAIRRAALKSVPTSCVAEYAKYCTPPTVGRPSARDQVICLKSHRPDLSLGCRSAVTAATK